MPMPEKNMDTESWPLFGAWRMAYHGMSVLFEKVCNQNICNSKPVVIPAETKAVVVGSYKPLSVTYRLVEDRFFAWTGHCDN